MSIHVPFRQRNRPLGVGSQRQCCGWQVLLHIDPRGLGEDFAWTIRILQDYIIHPNWLVVSTPLKNMSSSVGMILPNIWKNVPNHQAANIDFLLVSTLTSIFC